MSKKAKYKIVPSDITDGNWHIYRRDYWWWQRLPEHWNSLEQAELYIKHITGYGIYYDAKGNKITETSI